MDQEDPQPFPGHRQATDFDVERIVTKLSGDRDVNRIQHVIAQRKVSSECRECAWSMDGELLAWACEEYKVKIVSTESLQHSTQHTECSLMVECNYPVTSLVFITVDNQNADNVVENSGYQLLRWQEHRTVLAIGMKSGRVRLLNVSDGSILLELIDHKDLVSSLNVAKNNSFTLVSSSYDGTIKFWDLSDDGNMFHSFLVANYTSCRGVKHKVTSAVWSPDGSRVAATGTFKAVVIFDMVKKDLALTLSGHANKVNRCEFSPDGVLLITSSVDTTCLVWNSYTGEVICKLGHQFPEPCPWFPGESDTNVLHCSFSKSGLHVVTVADDGYTRFWDLCEPDSLLSICCIDNSLCCSFSQKGKYLAVGTASGDLVIVQPSPGVARLSHLSRLACNTAPHISYHTVDTLRIPVSLKAFLKYQSMEL